MNTKIWEAEWDNNKIRVENSWNWAGDVEEKVIVNSEVMVSHAYNYNIKKDVDIARALGSIFTFSYGDDNIKITIGQAWHFLGIACRIEVNGKYIGGNKIVLLAKKPSTD